MLKAHSANTLFFSFMNAKKKKTKTKIHSIRKNTVDWGR